MLGRLDVKDISINFSRLSIKRYQSSERVPLVNVQSSIREGIYSTFDAAEKFSCMSPSVKYSSNSLLFQCFY